MTNMYNVDKEQSATCRQQMTQSLLNVKTDETLILICEENPQFRPEPLSYALKHFPFPTLILKLSIKQNRIRTDINNKSDLNSFKF